MSGFTVRKKISFRRDRRNAKRIQDGHARARSIVSARQPRVSRLMALALHIDGLLRQGTIGSLAEAARLSHVTRARMTQLLNLTNLAPDIIEALLFLPRVESGRDPLSERDLRPITTELNWKTQRAMWRDLVSKKNLKVAR